jgi:hypothetical protein
MNASFIIILFIAYLVYRYSYLPSTYQPIIKEYFSDTSYHIPASLYSTSALLKKYRYIPEVHSLMKKYLSNESYTEKEFKDALAKIRETNPNDPELITFRTF